jgi:hypothetical protein
MKTSHIAALALIGWYLMLPPVEALQVRSSKDGHSHTIDWKTPGKPPPLSAWSIDGSYDTTSACLEAKRKAILSVPPDAVAPWKMAQCVASDDPRLAR